jgi:hypothetical protein
MKIAAREEIKRDAESLIISALSKDPKKLPYVLPPADFGHFGY